jgi:hypothetical protein
MKVSLSWPGCVSWMLVAILVGGCSTQERRNSSGEPRTSYAEMAAPAGAAHYTLQPGETAVKPVLDKRVSPVYPPTLVHSGAAPVTVVAQLVMDENGRVRAVHPQASTADGPCRALFDDAVEQAAMKWTFTPMYVQHPRGDGTYEMTQKPFSLLYVFDFRMVDGKPVVESDGR